MYVAVKAFLLLKTEWRTAILKVNNCTKVSVLQCLEVEYLYYRPIMGPLHMWSEPSASIEVHSNPTMNDRKSGLLSVGTCLKDANHIIKFHISQLNANTLTIFVPADVNESASHAQISYKIFSMDFSHWYKNEYFNSYKIFTINGALKNS